MGNEIVLEVNGQNITGWNRISFSRSMEALAGSFSIKLVNTPQVKDLGLDVLQECRVFL